MYRFTGFFVLLASVLMCAPAHAAEGAQLVLESPKPAPAMRYADSNRGFHTVAGQHAKLIAVHFWATWCAPCVGELPMVEDAAKTYGPKGLDIITVSMDGDHIDKVREFFIEHHIVTLTPYFDTAMDAFEASGGRGLPTTIFINEKNEEIARADGPLDWQDKSVTQFIESKLK